ncbi:hypothetical protein FSP39_004626 [Pinctada imbricata]|uniref:Probable U3 small nucleolar RNA-associated protein 11 n=1 Tax=Pinctada imbricata TaxID=66713 RepID=A0AA89BNL3_PINIB|nr:hypothetical protein FSP39_004626 [Pinctada imbricata]
MASLKNANKARARSHRERGQVESRAHLGFLEKKKDYRARAEDYQRKQNTLKFLKRKALDRNPDEFYFNMVKTQKTEGVHQERESTEPVHTEAELKLMYSQDQRYINMKRTSELRKIERLKSSLHVLDSETKPKNKHTVFVDSEKEAKDFDAAKYFNTHPALVNRTYNRPTLETLEKDRMGGDLDETDIEEMVRERDSKYSELAKRIEREKQLNVIHQKMETKKHLMRQPNNFPEPHRKERRGSPTTLGYSTHSRTLTVRTQRRHAQNDMQMVQGTPNHIETSNINDYT